MALQDELAELRAEVGPQVFDDPVAFRAAFDDFIPEGSASTGEVSLLVGAIATGALQRLQEQLALGADPEMTIAAQGDLLARDRGTSEASGPRWALSVLAHAVGAIPVDLVLTRPSVPDSLGAPDRPGSTPAGAVVEPGPTMPRPDAASSDPAAVLDATRVAGDPPVTPPPPAPPRAAPAPATADPGSDRGGRTNPLLLGALVVLALVAVVAVVLLFLRDGDSPDEPAAPDGDPTGSADEEVLAEVDITDAAEPVRVQLVRNGSKAELVLLLERDGELTEVDREPASCPYLESSYDADLGNSGGLDLEWGWDNLDQEGFGEYGRVVLEIESLDVFGLEDGYVCPTEP